MRGRGGDDNPEDLKKFLPPTTSHNLTRKDMPHNYYINKEDIPHNPNLNLNDFYNKTVSRNPPASHTLPHNPFNQSSPSFPSTKGGRRRRKMSAKKRKSMRGGKSKRTRGKKGKKNNKWVTALSAANQELEKTGSYTDARRSLRKQALHNATQIFGAIGDTM